MSMWALRSGQHRERAALGAHPRHYTGDTPREGAERHGGRSLPYAFAADFSTSRHAPTSGDGSAGLASYSMLMSPVNLTAFRASSTFFTSSTPLPNTTSVSRLLSWSLR